MAISRKLNFVDARHATAHFGIEHVHHANKARDEFIRGLLINFTRRADLFEVALGKDHDAVGNFHRFLLIVRDENRRHVQIVMQLHQPLAQLLPNLRVHRAERFIQQQHTRLGCQRTGDGDALTLTTGELMRKAFLQSAQAEQLDQFRHACFDVHLLPLLDLEAERDVLEHAHVSEQGVALEHKTDVALLHGHVIDPLPPNKNVSFRRHFQPGNHPQHRRLAAAAGTEQANQLSVVDREVHVVDGGNFAELFCDAS